MNSDVSFGTIEFINNFPFSNIRSSQVDVFKEINEAFDIGYKYIVLEAPTGFGKSAVGIAVALTLGSSYICTSTKELQSQYKRDFPYVRIAKGMNNFPCLLKENLIKNGQYKCGTCPSSNCSHTTVDYGPCLTRNSEIAISGCIYKPAASDYIVTDRGTKYEQVFLDSRINEKYQQEYSKWLQSRGLKEGRSEWNPCGYYDQLNVAINSSHSIFNYPMFLTLLPSKKKIVPRELLILDEGHLLETEVLNLTSFVLSKSKWRRYIPSFSIVNFGYDDSVEVWIEFLIKLEAKMLALLGDVQRIKELFMLRKQGYNWISKDIMKTKRRNASTKITDFIVNGEGSPVTTSTSENSEIEELDYTIAEFLPKKIGTHELEELAILDTERLTTIINSILSNPKNWIVYNIRKENDDIKEVEFKPLDISPYCRDIFDRCSRTLVMSATILNPQAYCRNVGLNPSEVKFIQVQSDFPSENRPIFPLDIAYLNYDNLQLQETKSSIVETVDNIMTIHKNNKGIIHTTSYEQLNLIKEYISCDNSQRLLVTDPNLQRVEVISKHINSTKPTVLISPSLYTGIDLNGELSRFQIITKIPYPNLNDRWINAKRNSDREWYSWQTALRLIQAYGRSIRSKEDWAKTYILDSAFGHFVNKNKSIFPDWFRQAIRSW